jgi:hypothetical protein
MDIRYGSNRAFLIAHGVLLAIVLVGFARSFYLRDFFLRGSLDLPLKLHGAALTSWYTLAFAQAGVMTAGRRDLHRWLAWVAAIVVAAVFTSSIYITARLARTLTSAADPENMFVWGNFVNISAFVGLVIAAVALRRRPDAHRRLLLMASILIIGAAIARLSFWPIFSTGIVGAPAFAIGGQLLLLAAALLFDRRQRGSVHRATWVGVATVLGSLVLAVGLGLSGLGFRLMQAVS